MLNVKFHIVIKTPNLNFCLFPQLQLQAGSLKRQKCMLLASSLFIIIAFPDNGLLGPLGLVQRRKGNATRRLTYHELASFSMVPVGEKSTKVAPFPGGEALVSFSVLTTVPLPLAVPFPRRMHVSSRWSVITSSSGTAPSFFC